MQVCRRLQKEATQQPEGSEYTNLVLHPVYLRLPASCIYTPFTLSLSLTYQPHAVLTL